MGDLAITSVYDLTSHALGKSTVPSPKVRFPPQVVSALWAAIKCIPTLTRLLLFLKHIQRIKFKFLI